MATAGRAARLQPDDRPETRRAARTPRAPTRSAQAARARRRQRERHFRRRRRDLLEDTVLAALLMVALVSVTAGLGVLLLVEVPLAAGLLASVLAERAIRKRRHRGRRSARRVRRA